MTTNDNTEWLTVEQVASLLGTSTRQAHRYAEGESARIRTRRAGRRILFYRPDVENLAEALGIARREPPAPPPTRPQVVVQQHAELLAYIRDLQEQIQQAAAREGYYKAQLESRLSLPDERSLRTAIEEERAQRIALEQQEAAARRELKALQGNQRWLIITIATLIIITLILGGVVIFLIR
jgi:hypothetical protein